MKVTKQYCDVCGKESERILTIDVDIPLCSYTDVYGNKHAILNTRVYSTPNTPKYPFGTVKCDGVWEIELCNDCLKTATSKLLEMKKGE